MKSDTQGKTYLIIAAKSLNLHNTHLFLTSAQLPDGRQVNVGGERFGAPEALFQPHLINVEGAGVSEMLFNTIQAADIDLRSEPGLCNKAAQTSDIGQSLMEASFCPLQGRLLQTHRPVGGDHHVPWTAIQTRERDKAALPGEGAEWRHSETISKNLYCLYSLEEIQ